MPPDRIAAEREFHDRRYSDDSVREDSLSKYYAAISYGFEMHRRRVRRYAAGRSVLEYGCGTGLSALELAKDAREVIGVDISEVAINQARAAAAEMKVRNARFLVENAEALSLSDRSVDLITGAAIIHHLDLRRALAEVRRVLAKGGIALFSEPLGHNPLLNWYRNRTPNLRTEDEHPLMIADLRQIMQTFPRTRITYFGLIAPILGVLPHRAREARVVRKIIELLDRAFCAVPLLRNWAWYCIVELGV